MSGADEWSATLPPSAPATRVLHHSVGVGNGLPVEEGLWIAVPTLLLVTSLHGSIHFTGWVGRTIQMGLRSIPTYPNMELTASSQVLLPGSPDLTICMRAQRPGATCHECRETLRNATLHVQLCIIVHRCQFMILSIQLEGSSFKGFHLDQIPFHPPFSESH